MRRAKAATALLAAGHAGVDLYQGAVPVLVPFLVAERHYGYVAASGIVLAATVVSSVVQPLFGMLTDRWAMPWLLPASTTTAGLGVALVGVGDSYLLTWLAIALSGIGIAAYHPEAARVARAVNPDGMSWFSLGGNIGFALAPVVVTPVLAAGGLGASPLLLVPALLGTLATVAVLRRGRAAVAAAARVTGTPDWPSFGRLTGVVVLRSITYVGLSTFAGLYVQQRLGGGPGVAGAALFTLFAGGAVGTVLGGSLARRWGRVRVVRWAYAAAVPAVAGVVLAPGPLVYAFLSASAIALYLPFSLHITLGQDYLPHRMGTASGVTLGLTVSVGGVFAPVLGAVAEATSLRVTLGLLVAPPALALLLALTLREPQLGADRGAVLADRGHRVEPGTPPGDLDRR